MSDAVGVWLEEYRDRIVRKMQLMGYAIQKEDIILKMTDPLQAELVQATKAQTEAINKLADAVAALANAMSIKLERLALATERQIPTR